MTRFYIGFLILIVPSISGAWNNGQSGNASTNHPDECSSPPYSTHDWVADHALALLPDNEKVWLLPHKTAYLMGTEAPDNKKIPTDCEMPHNGYDDRNRGHSVEWNSDGTQMIKDRAAVRAQEEYSKAVIAFEQGDSKAAAFYLGAMAHYIGDTSQYGHTVTTETSKQHSKYEGWVSRRTKSFDGGHFEDAVVLDSLVRRRPYTAVKRISKITAHGKGDVLTPSEMISLYETDKNSDSFKKSVGQSLNIGVNELADVLHTYFKNVVEANGT